MPDTKVSAMATITAPVTRGDLLYIIDDPAGTPLSRKVTVEDVLCNGNWVAPLQEISLVDAAFTLSNATGVQSVFPAAQDVLTVQANSTYFIEGQYIIGTGATTHTTAMAFAAGGGVVVTFLEYLATLFSSTANGIATAHSSKHNSGVASAVLNATSGAVRTQIWFRGTLRIGATGGTLTPQIAFSAAPGVTCQTLVGSYIRAWRLGSNTFVKSGAWA